MVQNKKTPIRFARTQRDFTETLNSRVNSYFKLNGISRYGNSEMFIKTICMFAMYLVPYFLLVTGVVASGWLAIPLMVVMSIGLAGIGLSIMHDANHGAYSNKKWINTLLGYSLNMVGASAFNWKLQHNVLHHTYTNVHDADEDISSRGVLRMTPHTPWKSIHKFQVVYAWFLYGLMTIVWMVVKDFSRLIRYHREGFLKTQRADVGREWVILILTKLIYVGYILVIPMIFSPFAWWQVMIGFIMMHYIAGFLLAIIFQPAHVVDGTEFPLPNNDNELMNNWAIHQLHTTTNFANKSRWFTWYVGGLNFQIEHHLFPNICHVHYRKISSIVRSTAEEFGLPYKSATTFVDALAGHARILVEYGRRPVTAGH